MNGFLLLIQFMTRIPIPMYTEYSPREIGKAIKYFPLVGLLIGVILTGIFFILNPFIESKLVLALVIVLVEVLLTGGLHVDGLADTFDGIFSYRDRERILEIMKDSCVGANGALAIIFFVVAKVILVSELGWEFLLIMPMFSRMNTVVHAGFGHYAREEGMGKSIVDETTKQGTYFAIAFAFLIGALLIGWNVVWVGFAALGFGFMSLHYIQKRIGGITGDTMGAVLELTSLVVLFAGVVSL